MAEEYIQLVGAQEHLPLDIEIYNILSTDKTKDGNMYNNNGVDSRPSTTTDGTKLRFIPHVLEGIRGIRRRNSSEHQLLVDVDLSQAPRGSIKTNLNPPLPGKRYLRPPNIWYSPASIWSRSLYSLIFILVLAILPTAMSGVYSSKALVTNGYSGNLPYYDCTYKDYLSFRGLDFLLGDMSFTQAKGIDLVWNTVVGRGLQVLFSYSTYRISANMLMRIAEEDQLSYEVFVAMALSPTKLETMLPVCRSLASKTSIRTKAASIWSLISIIYLVFLPTLLDATSGYQAIQYTKLDLGNGALLDVSDGVWTGIYTTHDRKEPPKSLLLSANILNETAYHSISDSIFYTVEIEGQWDLYANNNETAFLSLASYCINDTTSELYTLSDGLTETNLYASATYDDAGCLYVYPFTPSITIINATFSEVIDVTNYSILSNRTAYSCEATSKYQWGFSSGWAILLTSVSAFWFLGTWWFWFEAERHSQFVQKGRGFGKWRAILDLADAIKMDLGLNLCAYSDQEIEDSLNRKGPIKYGVDEDGNIVLSSVATKEKLFLEWGREYGVAGGGDGCSSC